MTEATWLSHSYYNKNNFPVSSHLRRPSQLMIGGDNSSSTEPYYSVVDPILTPVKVLSLTRVDTKDVFRISQCPIYEANKKEETDKEITNLDNNFIYSVNEAYEECTVPERSSQTSIERPTYQCNAHDQTSDTMSRSSKEDFAINQCPAYSRHETDNENENGVGSYHCARGNFPIDLDMVNKASVECNSTDSL